MDMPKPYWFDTKQLQEIGKLAYYKPEDKELVTPDSAEQFRGNMFQMFNTSPSLAVASFLMWIGDDEILEEFKEKLNEIKDATASSPAH